MGPGDRVTEILGNGPSFIYSTILAIMELLGHSADRCFRKTYREGEKVTSSKCPEARLSRMNKLN